MGYTVSRSLLLSRLEGSNLRKKGSVERNSWSFASRLRICVYGSWRREEVRAGLSPSSRDRDGRGGGAQGRKSCMLGSLCLGRSLSLG